MIRLHVDKFKDTTWDVLICDEAHIIKNAHSKTSKAMRKIESRHRYLLTGTPIQTASEYRHLSLRSGSSLDLIANDEDEVRSFDSWFKIQSSVVLLVMRQMYRNGVISLTRSLHEAARPFVLRRT